MPTPDTQPAAFEPSSDVVEDIIEDIATDPSSAVVWVQIALRALGPEFDELWTKAFFPQEDVDYAEFIKTTEHIERANKIERMLSEASGHEMHVSIIDAGTDEVVVTDTLTTIIQANTDLRAEQEAIHDTLRRGIIYYIGGGAQQLYYLKRA